MKIKPDYEKREQFIKELSKYDDIVLKGYSAMEILLSADKLAIYRGTVDIDADCTDLSKDQSDLNKIIGNICTKLSLNYIVNRKVTENSSSGYYIYNSCNLNTPILKIDINIKECNSYSEIDVNDNCYKIYSIYSMLADKLSVISSNYVRRRVKDVLDTYVIISNYDVSLQKLMYVVNDRKRFIDNFDCYFYRLVDKYGKTYNENDMQTAWNSIVTTNPVDLNKCRKLINVFIEPFITGDLDARIVWNHNTGLWVVDSNTSNSLDVTDLFK